MPVHFELESDREVLLPGVGMLPAGEPVVVDAEAERMFNLVHGTTIPQAHFAPYVTVTAVYTEEPTVTEESNGGE